MRFVLVPKAFETLGLNRILLPFYVYTFTILSRTGLASIDIRRRSAVVAKDK